MEKLISYGGIYIILAVSFILLVKDIVQSNKNTDVKVFLLPLCIKYQKNIYNVKEAVLFLLITHIVAILLLILLRVPYFLGI